MTRGVLIVTNGEQVGRVVRVPGQAPLVIGRAPECEVCVDDRELSRRHADVRQIDGVHLLRDLESSNGTFVNERRVGDAVVLEDGDRVRVGPLRLRFSLVDEEEERALGAAYEGTQRLRKAIGPPQSGSDGPVVRDPAMHRLYDEARRAAQAAISVLILGETGAGKEILARAIHVASPRASRPYVAINCAAISASLLEAELFGHEKGAFTGALQSKAGLFEAADGGTLFLDEIGELPLGVQVKLLRVLEERAVMRVGGRTASKVDVRFLAATNRDLEADVKAGTFRADLYYRLAAVILEIPPLRDRPSEIEELARMFADGMAASLGRRPLQIAPGFLQALSRHDWPGNVRELRNVVERAVVMSTSDTLDAEHVPQNLRGSDGSARPSDVAPRGDGGALRDEMAQLERSKILDALDKSGGNQSHAAVLLGMSRRTLVKRLGEWGLTKPRKPR